MKRALGLILIIAACVAGFLSIRGTMPFLPVFGTSMEPEFHAGNLITIEQISPSEVKEGDVIVFNVPPAVREYYNYPPVVAHRVIEVNTKPGISFRTKGDNTGEDPFTVRAQDLRGKVGQQIPYLGFPLLFLQSQQGLIFMILGLFLFALYLYAGDLNQGRQRVQKGILAPAIQESRLGSHLIAQKMEATEQRMASTEQKLDSTQEALNNFASAMGEYAQHLASHTSAVKDLASVSQDLRGAVHEQNRFFSQWSEAAPHEDNPTVKDLAGASQELRDAVHEQSSASQELRDTVREQSSGFQELRDTVCEQSSASQELRETVREQSSASQELRDAVHEQNRLFNQRREATPKERPVRALKLVPGCYRQEHPATSTTPQVSEQ